MGVPVVGVGDMGMGMNQRRVLMEVAVSDSGRYFQVMNVVMVQVVAMLVLMLAFLMDMGMIMRFG